MTSTTRPWADWEDWHAGLYARRLVRAESIVASLALLADADTFLEVGHEMVRTWPHAARHNLDHMWSGRRAWIGQASCCYAHGATADETKQAWGGLANAVQARANAIADEIADAYHRGWRYAQTLFTD